MKKGSNYQRYILPAVLIVIATFYWGMLRPLLPQLIAGEGPELLQQFVYGLYPRLQAEANRLPERFFMNKADQLLIRFALVALLFWLWYYYRAQIIWHLTFPKAGKQTLRWQRVIFYTFLFYITHDWWSSIPPIVVQSAFYKPISFLGVFDIPFPSVNTFRTLYVLMLTAATVTICGWQTKYFGWLTIGLFILMQAFFSSFEKLDHGYATYIYAGLLFPLAYSFYDKSDKRRTVLIAIRATIALTYFQAGAEKLLNSGLHWLRPETMQAFLVLHPTKIGQLLAQSDLFCILSAPATVLFQLTFPLVLFCKPQWRWIWIGGGFVFHFGTVLLMGIGSYFSPWLVVYIFFVDTFWREDNTSTSNTGKKTIL